MGARFTRRTVCIAVLAVVCAGTALAAPATGPLTVNVSAENTLGANILVNSKGLALYHFVPETKATIKCTGSCAVLWPPLIVPAGMKPVAGPGVTAAELGTIKRPDGRMQVTYNGLALYRDFYDKSGMLNGQGQNGMWFAVTSAGNVTKARVPAPAVAAAAAVPVATTGSQTAGTASAGDGTPPPRDCVVVDDGMC
jgi:predicted lipoprotein with Yx(FWY)xxD motif